MGEFSISFTEHAVRQARRRRLDMAKIADVARWPEQTVHVRPGREFRQSMDGAHLMRVLVEVTESEVLVITMYRTSRVTKYWQP